MTPRRLTLRGVGFFELKIRISWRNFFRKTILAYLSGAQVDWIHRIKKCQKSRGTATLTLHLYSLAEDENVTIVDGGSRVSLE